MSCRERVTWRANMVIDDVHAYLYDKAWETHKFTWATIPFRIFTMFDTAFLRAALLFGGEEAYWLIDNRAWPDY